MMTITELSILIPTYNDLCVKLVGELRQQAEASCLTYEILVADDGSTDRDVTAENQQISSWSHCHYLQQPANMGRAAIRNLLASQAQYRHLLFIDSDMTVRHKDYLARYLMAGEAEVIDGGVTISGDSQVLKGNLRYQYEKSCEQSHTAERRRRHPYRDFHTANFLIRRYTMLSHPFDERFRHYGYEDVLLGKQLQKDNVRITHIDNPLAFSTFEENASFVAKTEEGLHTLHRFRSELRGYSRLLTLIEGIHIPMILSLIRLWHKAFGRLERKWLLSTHPSLKVFSLYRLGYYLTLK